DQRQQLIPFAAQGREDRCVDQPAERGADGEGDGDAQDVAAADQMHEKIGGEGPERYEIGVREIDLHEHAVDQRQAQRHQDVQTSENNAVDRLLQDDRCCHFPISSTSDLSTTCPAWFPCSGWCPSWCSGWSCRTPRCR